MTDNKFQVKLINKHQIAQDAVAFEIEKPDSFRFVPGQTIDVALNQLPQFDPKVNKRIFSIASAPSEKNLMFATKLTGSIYKKALNKIKINDNLGIDGPYGVFKLHRDAKSPAVLIAGGIGITPFRSMILDARDHDFPHQIWLFYSNSNNPIPFHYTISNINHAHFKYIPTITGNAESWYGEVGRINSQLIRKYIINVFEPFYYLAGPSKMVEAIKKMLLGLGVLPDHVKQSIFIGY